MLLLSSNNKDDTNYIVFYPRWIKLMFWCFSFLCISCVLFLIHLHYMRLCRLIWLWKGSFRFTELRVKLIWNFKEIRLKRTQELQNDLNILSVYSQPKKKPKNSPFKCINKIRMKWLLQILQIKLIQVNSTSIYSTLTK